MNFHRFSSFFFYNCSEENFSVYNVWLKLKYQYTFLEIKFFDSQSKNYLGLEAR